MTALEGSGPAPVAVPVVVFLGVGAVAVAKWDAAGATVATVTT